MPKQMTSQDIVRLNELIKEYYGEEYNSELILFFNYVKKKQCHANGVYNYLKNTLTPYNNINSFEQYINAIYQIRCNLVHCSKDLTNEHDQSLVKKAFVSFKLFLEKLED